MMPLGALNDWIDLLDSYIPDIVALIFDTWPTLPPPAGDELEDAITKELCHALRRSRAARALPFRIDFQYVELDPAAGQEEGRLDISFSPPVPREDIYFALECKRLNVREMNNTIRPYHSEYVKFGMVRFVSGQYGPLVHSGGMLGYVLDGEVDYAINGVEANIRKSHVALGMIAPGTFLRSSVRPTDSYMRQTEHRPPSRASAFTIHHLFVACDSRTPLRAKGPAPCSSSGRRRRRRKSL